MRLSVINNKYQRVIKRSFAHQLLTSGYQQKDNQFYLKSDQVGKLVTIQRDLTHSYYHQVAIFTIRVQILSDDVWELTHPGQELPVFPFEGYPYSVFDRNLGQFYGKKRGTQWLALDATAPEQIMISYLNNLILTRILPYLNQFNSVDDILQECERMGFSHLRMLLLARLGRKEEARAELKKLIASRHQLGFRTNIVNVAQRLGII
ncbi:DUF4304 domain-containing protein [Spirosoma pollinicola]|uniref:DUF4304 domain-containing protein n=1 Tax=Spirosoma pollinicola TaxID=2057025 RepID=A0A2K8Z2M1_9BACT|nr:DUF4304 domain-containing protein [Spirosoma pollinicola]AUD04130.1 hypothetical protein CWM47_21220 [Spirosoma pollinicola]